MKKRSGQCVRARTKNQASFEEIDYLRTTNMRLLETQRLAIKTIVADIVGSGSRVWLFASRALCLTD
ncbi:MAG: hypothetical protein ABL892_01985 [Thiobacillaceae bacterium]